MKYSILIPCLFLVICSCAKDDTIIVPNQTYDDIILCQQNNESKRIGGTEEKRLLQLLVHPSPTSDILEIQVTTTLEEINKATLSVFIYNSIGQKMLERDTKYEAKETFDVQGFEAGIYAVMIRNKAGILLRSTKVIVLSN